MRVLGVVPSSTHIQWALLAGVQAAATLEELPSKTQKLPADQDEAKVLYRLKGLLATFLRDHKVEKVSVLAAGRALHGNPSTLRTKVEAVFQLASVEVGVPCAIVSPQSLRAREKRFGQEVGHTLEEVFNRGETFVPQAWRDAVLVAWYGLGP
jgi:hypothetical protein